MTVVRLRIHVANRGSKDIVGPDAFKKTAIGIKRTGIAFQIGRIVKLCWVQEHADNRNIIFFYTAFHERGMSSM